MNNKPVFKTKEGSEAILAIYDAVQQIYLSFSTCKGGFTVCPPLSFLSY